MGSDKGNASSTTKAAISGVAGNTEARTGDAETGIKSIFDKEKVRKELDAQMLITQQFGPAASKAVGDLAGAKASALRQEVSKEKDPVKQAALLDEAARWDEGGIYRSIAHVVIGGLSGGAAGAAGAGAAALSADAINRATENLPEGVKQLVGAAIALGIGNAVGGNAGAVTAFNADLNNRQLHPKEVIFLGDKERIKRYVDYMKARGVTLTEAEAAKALNQYGAAMADLQWGVINGRDATTEAFILGEASKSPGTYKDNLGVQHRLFSVTEEEYRNELINLKPLFNAINDPVVYKYLTDNSDDKSRLKNWIADYKAGQLKGYEDAGKNASLLGDLGTILRGVKELPAHILESLKSDEKGPFDEAQMKSYYQNLLRLQGRGAEAGYISEYEWDTVQRLTILGIPLAEMGGIALGTVGSRLVRAVGREGAEASAAKRGATVSEGVEGVSCAGVACFTQGTLVQTAKGLQPIESFKGGELVLSRDERTQALGYRPVIATKLTHEQSLYEVVVRNRLGQTETLHTTSEHPFWIVGTGWIKASLLESGMALMDRDGQALHVDSQRALAQTATVYNIQVDEHQTYHVGSWGVWVHNAKCCDLQGRPIVDPTKRGVISPTKLSKNEVSLDLTPEQKIKANDIATKGDPGGVKTEALFNEVVKGEGGNVLDGGKYGSNNGFDHVAVFRDAEGNVHMTLLVDSKQLGSKGVVLDPKAAGGQMQMSDAWDAKVLNNLPKNSPARLAIERAQIDGTLVKGVAYIDRSTATLKLTRIDPKVLESVTPKPPMLPPNP